MEPLPHLEGVRNEQTGVTKQTSCEFLLLAAGLHPVRKICPSVFRQRVSDALH